MQVIWKILKIHMPRAQPYQHKAAAVFNLVLEGKGSELGFSFLSLGYW